MAIVSEPNRRPGDQAEKTRAEVTMKVEDESRVDRPELGNERPCRTGKGRPAKRRAGQRAKFRPADSKDAVEIGVVSEDFGPRLPSDPMDASVRKARPQQPYRRERSHDVAHGSKPQDENR